MEHDVEGGAAVLGHESLDGGAAGGGGDVGGEGEGAAEGADGDEIDAKEEGPDGGASGCDLEPASGRGAEVEEGAGGGEEPELGVELEELEGGSGSVALLLGEVVVLVQPVLPLRLPHRPFPSRPPSSLSSCSENRKSRLLLFFLVLKTEKVTAFFSCVCFDAAGGN